MMACAIYDRKIMHFVDLIVIHRPCLCHIRNCEGFNLYIEKGKTGHFQFNVFGFNLQAENEKAGHFVGKVDPLSPADFAGFKQCDRIVEINGTNISEYKNYLQVVMRIKAVADSTKLLVVDNEAYECYSDLKIVIRSDMLHVIHGKTPDRNPDDGVAMVNNVNRHSTNSSHSLHSAHSDSPAGLYY